jgi:hypothetical protein
VAGKLTGETDRRVGQREHDGVFWAYIEGGMLSGAGEALTPDEAMRNAEVNFENNRRALLRIGEGVPEDYLIDTVADCIRLHQEAVNNGNLLYDNFVRWGELSEEVRDAWRTRARYYMGRKDQAPMPERGEALRGAVRGR